jgi:hypothetical protein
MRAQTSIQGLRRLVPQPNSHGCTLATSTSLQPRYSQLRSEISGSSRVYSSTVTAFVHNCSGSTTLDTSSVQHHPLSAISTLTSKNTRSLATIAIRGLNCALPRRPTGLGSLNHIRRPGNNRPSRHVNTSSSVYVSHHCPAQFTGSLYFPHHRPVLVPRKHTPSSLWLELMASTLTQRRGHANKAHSHEHNHSSEDEHDHSHSHSHGLFHSHSHSHGGAEGANEIIKVLSGSGTVD